MSEQSDPAPAPRTAASTDEPVQEEKKEMATAASPEEQQPQQQQQSTSPTTTTTSEAPPPQGAAKQESPVSSPNDILPRGTFDYMMKKDIPTLVDSICQYLTESQPADPMQGIIEFLNGKRQGAHGGVAIAGRSVGGGWLRIVDSAGNLTGSVDRLPFHPHGGIQLLAVATKDPILFVAMNLCDGDGDSIERSTTSSSVGDSAALCEIRQYDFKGNLLYTIPLPKAVSAIEIEKDKAHLWVAYRNGGGSVLQLNGSKVFDLPGSAHWMAIKVRDNHYWTLSNRAIEQREIETGVLKAAIHLPESMLRSNTFLLGIKHIYVASPNPDGSANYVGVFDFYGRPATHFVPQAGSILAFDHSRGGLWQTTRNGQVLSFTNEKGAKVITTEMHKAKNVNIVVDKGSGLLWYYRHEGDMSLLASYDPMRGVYRADIEVPELVGGVTQMIAL